MQTRLQDEITMDALVRPRTADSTGLIARGAVQNLVSRAGFFVFGYLASIILARGLGPAEYGVYGLVMSVLLWVEQISKLMIPSAAAILIPRENEQSSGLEQTALFLNVSLFVGLAIVLWLAAPMLADLFGIPDGAAWFRLAALDLPFFGAYVVYRGVLQGHQRFFSISVAELLYSLAKFVGAGVLLALWLSVPGALLLNVVASVAALLFALSQISIKPAAPTGKCVRSLMHLALPLGVYMLGFQTIGSLDLWLLKALDASADAATIGVYVAARNVAIVPGVVLMVISDILLPSLSRAVAQGDITLSRQYIQSGVRWLCLAMAPIFFLFVAAGDTIMTLLYSAGFGAGGLYLKILVFYGMSLPFIDLFASALNARGKPYLSGATLFLLTIVASPLTAVLVLSFGSVGAASASAATGFFCAGVLAFLVYRRFGSIIRLRSAINVAAACLVLIAAATQFIMTGPLFAVSWLACLVLYGAALVFLGEIKSHELEPLAFWRWR